jgi:5-methylcytosine-specific restriction endonuclease McrA
MSASLRDRVRQRASNRCEYCQMPAELDSLEFHWDHIIAQKHRGPTEFANLAWSCFACNNQKQSDIRHHVSLSAWDDVWCQLEALP